MAVWGMALENRCPRLVAERYEVRTGSSSQVMSQNTLILLSAPSFKGSALLASLLLLLYTARTVHIGGDFPKRKPYRGAKLVGSSLLLAGVFGTVVGAYTRNRTISGSLGDDSQHTTFMQYVRVEGG